MRWWNEKLFLECFAAFIFLKKVSKSRGEERFFLPATLKEAINAINQCSKYRTYSIFMFLTRPESHYFPLPGSIDAFIPHLSPINNFSNWKFNYSSTHTACSNIESINMKNCAPTSTLSLSLHSLLHNLWLYFGNPYIAWKNIKVEKLKKQFLSSLSSVRFLALSVLLRAAAAAI